MNKNIFLFSLKGPTLESILSSINTEEVGKNNCDILKTVVEPIFNPTVEYCGTCYIRCENKSHYQSEFHNFNMQLKLRHLPRVSIEEFEKLSMEEKSSMIEESDSSSSSDEDDLIMKNDPKISLITKEYKIKFYKVLLLHDEDDTTEERAKDIKNLFAINKSCHFGIFMFRSGYFSAGIIENVFILFYYYIFINLG